MTVAKTNPLRDEHPEFDFTPSREEIRFPIDDEEIIIYPALLTKWELVTLKIIIEHGPIHQREIIRMAPWMGCHPKYETDIGIPNKEESTMRQCRQLIHDVRIKYDCPILSGPKGYWPATTKKEFALWTDGLERRAKAEAASFLRSYQSVVKILDRLGIKRSDYFDQQDFDNFE